MKNLVDLCHNSQKRRIINNSTKDWNFPKDIIYFRRMIGNPVSKITGKAQDMSPFQADYHNAIQDWHWVELLKSRKLGATETANTSIALNCFDRYVGHDVLFAAGNELKVSREVLYRFYELLMDKNHDDGRYAFRHYDPELIEAHKKNPKEVPWKDVIDSAPKIYEHDIIKKHRSGQEPMIEFNNGTRAFAWAVSRQEKSQSFRGADDLICIFFTEAAHTGMKDDTPIMDALRPNLAQRDNADFILESTGNGKRGFFYDYWIQTMKELAKQFKMPLTDDTHQSLVNKLHVLWQEQRHTGKKKIHFPVDWFPLMYDYTVGLKENILSQKHIDREKRNPKVDFAQEYMGRFTSTYTSAIDTSNLKYIPEDESDPKMPDDLLELIGKNSVQH